MHDDGRLVLHRCRRRRRRRVQLAPSPPQLFTIWICTLPLSVKTFGAQNQCFNKYVFVYILLYISMTYMKKFLNYALRVHLI